MARLRKLTEELCDECIYMSGAKNHGCNYLALTNKSRVFENRNKVVPDGYCDKFKKGRKITNFMRAWEKDHRAIILSEKGGEIYEREYHKFIDRADCSDADT